MVFRNDYGSLEKQTLEPSHTTDLGIAFSEDGIHWTAGPKPVFKLKDEEFVRGYDPRLTVIGGRCLHVLRCRYAAWHPGRNRSHG